MDSVRRLNPASSSDLGSSPITPKTPVHLATPTSHPETPFVPETPWTGDPDEPDSLKWFKRYQRPGKRAHPYSLAAISLQTQGPVKKQSSHAQFWPFVGPYKPKKKVTGVNLDEWEERVAIAAGDKLIVGQCSDERPEEPWVVLWDLKFAKDELFQVAWTFDLFTYHPLIACAGKLGLIYIIDAVTKALVRTLKGHGSEILSLSLCQSHPHILASSSGDKTVRIWNICGSDVPPPLPGHKLSENYPMGNADEGNTCVAILAGEGSGGHRSKVIGCAFHPNHAAVATCSSDYSVKIWALPPFPRPDPTGPPTPRGYRPKVLYFPVFSTNRIHDNTIDGIQWLGPDILISRDVEGLVIWQWLGYKRFFHPRKFDAVNLESQRTDFSESHSYMTITNYFTSKASLRWYILFGIHQAFLPTPEELRRIEKGEELVTDPLIAIPVDSRPPEIHLFNPLLAQPDPPPSPITESRPLAPDDMEFLPEGMKDDVDDDDDEEEIYDEEVQMKEVERQVIEQVEGESELSINTPSGGSADKEEGETELDTATATEDVDMSVTFDTPPTTTVGTPTKTTSLTISQTLQAGQTLQASQVTGSHSRTEGMSAIERVKLQPRNSKRVTLVPESLEEAQGRRTRTAIDTKTLNKGKEKEKEKEKEKRKKNPSLAPYVLRATAWQSAIKASSLAQRGPLEKSVISCCAISPRGAKWIIGVGDVQSVFVFRLQQ